ncbi:hypothetical protein B0I35DRAFT_140158 [Stachybotrys elegans]|uniref:Uncharacterized protein n=1 Tax=Stachybotrys elegans TaxID=80388 RepID=A0A8K0WX77_9HYPO|nr:hypothetical protein B0I35DRAFT_140158 [Stachybotrys elegans]
MRPSLVIATVCLCTYCTVVRRLVRLVPPLLSLLSVDLSLFLLNTNLSCSTTYPTDIPRSTPCLFSPPRPSCQGSTAIIHRHVSRAHPVRILSSETTPVSRTSLIIKRPRTTTRAYLQSKAPGYSLVSLFLLLLPVFICHLPGILT